MFNIVGDLKTLAVAAAFCVLFAAGGGAVGYFKGKEACQVKDLKADIKGVQTHDQIQNQIIQLPDPDLNKRLGRWMRPS